MLLVWSGLVWSALASLVNCALYLDVDELVDAGFIKRFHEGERTAKARSKAWLGLSQRRFRRTLTSDLRPLVGVFDASGADSPVDY